MPKSFAKPTKLPDTKKPFARRLSRYETRNFLGEELKDLPPPEAPLEYTPPSMLAEHKGWVIIFGVITLALAAYWIKSVRTPHPPAPPPPAQSVYIEMVPAPKPTPQ